MDKDRWLKELALFIVEGHTNGWAAKSAEIAPLFPGMQSIRYARGDWEYRDNYSGYFRAPGLTIVSYKGVPVWSMTYFGPGQTPGYEAIAEPTFIFLRSALKLVTPVLPFRGPFQYADGDWSYTFTLLRGDIVDFLSEETISKDSVIVFAQTIGGGIIIDKDARHEPVYPWTL
jgi:hypothetical protein